MNKEEFLIQLSEDLELEEDITLETNLKDMEDWDSLTAMVLIGFFSDKFEVAINAEDIEKMGSIASLLTSKNVKLD